MRRRLRRDHGQGRAGPQGLIAYDTDAAVADRTRGRKPDYKLLRPRTIYYGGRPGPGLGGDALGLR